MRKKGKWLGGYPILGYDPDWQNKKLVVNQVEVQQVRAMFDMYLQEKSLSQAAIKLNENGIRQKAWTTKGGRRRGGGLFRKTTLQFHLRNPIYIGFVRHHGVNYPGEHAGIIDQATFDKVQTLLDRNGVRRTAVCLNKHKFLLQKLVKCKVCGSVMTTYYSKSKGKAYAYYRCTKVNNMDRGQCSVRHVGAREMEAFVLDCLSEMGRNQSLVDRVVGRVMASNRQGVPPLHEERSRLAADLRKVNEEAARLVDALSEAGRGGPANIFVVERLDKLAERKSQLEAEKERIRFEIERLENQTIDAGALRQTLSGIRQVFDALLPQEKLDLIHLLIKEIVYDGIGRKVRLAVRHLPNLGSLINDNWRQMDFSAHCRQSLEGLRG